MNWPIKKFDFKTMEINFLVLTILLYLFRTTIPILKFPFILVFFGLIIYFISVYGIKILHAFKDFFHIFYLGIFLAVIQITSFLLSNKLYLLIFKDCINSIILTSLFFLMTLCITSRSDLNIFIKNLINYIFIFAFIISARLLCNDFNIIPASSDLSSDKSIWLSIIRSASSEYNLNLVPVLLGLVCTIYYLAEAKTRVKKGVLSLILIMHTLTVLLSGSRRGLFVLSAIFSIFIFAQLFALFRNKSNLKKQITRFLVFLTSSFLLTFLTHWFFFKSPFYHRNIVPDLTASKYSNSVKAKIAFAAYRYISIIENDISYAATYDKIWVNCYVKALDTRSSTGTTIQKTVSPNIGEKVENGNSIAAYPLNEITTKKESSLSYSNIVEDPDPIRNWAAKFIQEDTTYFKYKSNLSVNNFSNRFIGDRVMRLQFSVQIFLKEFNWRQKLFGGGFNYLNWFGFRFFSNKSLSDYPHNPYFAVLLYSGIFGLLVYLFFMFRGISFYLESLRVYPILSVFFLITFIFSFFSGNGPFDPPVMGFLAFLPFFIHSIHKRTEQW